MIKDFCIPKAWLFLSEIQIGVYNQQNSEEYILKQP